MKNAVGGGCDGGGDESREGAAVKRNAMHCGNVISFVYFHFFSLFDHILQFKKIQMLRLVLRIWTSFLRRNQDVNFMSRPEGVGKTTGNANPLSPSVTMMEEGAMPLVALCDGRRTVQ